MTSAANRRHENMWRNDILMSTLGGDGGGVSRLVKRRRMAI